MIGLRAGNIIFLLIFFLLLFIFLSFSFFSKFHVLFCMLFGLSPQPLDVAYLHAN